MARGTDDGLTDVHDFRSFLGSDFEIAGHTRRQFISAISSGAL